ncbi:MAG: hypothetical protein QW356_04485 [Candidatus Hadarchaeales archaeon]
MWRKLPPWFLPVAGVGLLIASVFVLLASFLTFRPAPVTIPAPRQVQTGDLEIEDVACYYLSGENSALLFSLETRIRNTSGETLDTGSCWALAKTGDYLALLELPDRLLPGTQTLAIFRWFRRVPEGFVESWGPEIGENATISLHLGIYCGQRTVSSMLRENGTLLASRDFTFRYPQLY